MEQRVYIISGILISILIVGFILWRLKVLGDIIAGIVNDTLKRDGKWSRTSFTMLTAWFAALSSYVYDFIKNGFNFEAFMVLVGVALGVKVTDAWSKKIDPLIQPNKEDGK